MSEEERRRLEELWTRFLARETLSVAERSTLAAALERDASFRRRMVQDLQIDGALRGAGEADRGQDAVVSAVRALVTAAGRTEEVVAAVRKRIEAKTGAARMPPSTAVEPIRRRGLALAAFVVMAGAAAALFLLKPRPSSPVSPVASRESNAVVSRGEPTSGRAEDRSAPPGARAAPVRVEALEGVVYRHGAGPTLRATPTLELTSGDWISTAGATARARVAGPGSSRIDLGGDAVAAFSESGVNARLFVAQGKAVADLPGSGALVLASPHAIISGSGTVRVDVGPAATRVEVSSGSARVSALGVQRGSDVRAGQFALVRADDLQPPRAQAVREALLLTGPDDTKEDPPPPGGLRGSEEKLKAHLEHLGFQVSALEASTLTADRARGATLLVLSSSVSSNLLEPWFAELPVPMLVLESTGFEQLGLTGGRWRRDVGATPPVADVVIQNEAHPLAGGLFGNVHALSAPLNLRWVVLPPGATPIASYAGAPEGAVLMFGYERGAATNVGVAPARRVGLPFGNGRVIRSLTAEGWRLFDAAARWATGS